MSLIYEALKKLEREKRAPDRGFLVVAQEPWPERRSRRWLPLLAAVGLVAGGIALGRWLSTPAPAETPVRSMSTAAPAATATAPPDASRAAAATSVSEPPSEPAPPAASPLAATSAPLESPRRAESPSRPVSPIPVPTLEPLRGPSSSTDAAHLAPSAPTESAARSESATGVAAGSAESWPSLQAIGQRDGQPVAILDGALARVGDVVAGVKVLRIGTAEVEVERDGETYVLGFE